MSQDTSNKKEFHFWCWRNCGVPVSVVADNQEDAKNKIRDMFANGTMDRRLNDIESPGYADGFYIVSEGDAPKRKFQVKVFVSGSNTYMVDAVDAESARQHIWDEIRIGNIDESHLTNYGPIMIDSCVEVKDTNKEA